MDVPKGTFKFQRMSWMLTLRDLLVPPEEILREVDVQPGFRLLDCSRAFQWEVESPVT